MSEGLAGWQGQQHNYWTGGKKKKKTGAAMARRSPEEGCSEQKPRQVSQSWRKEGTQRPASPSINRPRLFHAVVGLWCWHICRLREKIFMELGHEPKREGGGEGRGKEWDIWIPTTVSGSPSAVSESRLSRDVTAAVKEQRREQERGILVHAEFYFSSISILPTLAHSA